MNYIIMLRGLALGVLVWDAALIVNDPYSIIKIISVIFASIALSILTGDSK